MKNHFWLYFSAFRENRFLSGSFLVLSGSFVVNVLNYAFNLLAGRLLAPEAYAEVAFLLVLSTLVAAPLGSIRLLLTQRVAVLSGRSDTSAIALLIRLTRRVSIFLGLAVFTLLFLASPLLARFFSMPLLPLLVLAFLAPASLALSLSSGVAQGLSDFRSFSLSSIIATLVKFFGGIGFILLKWGASGVALALALGALLSHRFLISTKTLQNFWRDPVLFSFRSVRLASFHPRTILGLVPRSFPIALGATLLTTLWGGIDIILAKRVLDSGDAGILSAVAVLGRIITYGGGAITTVLLPLVAALPETGPLSNATARASTRRAERRLLGLALLVSGSIGISVLALFWIASPLVVSALFGERYLPAAPFLPAFGMAMFLGSLSSIFASHFLARLQPFFLLPFALVVLGFAVSFFVGEPSISSIVRAELIANIALFVSFVGIFFVEHAKKTNRSEKMSKVMNKKNRKNLPPAAKNSILDFRTTERTENLPHA